MSDTGNDDKDWFSPDVATFGDRLAAAREQAGLDQAEMARRLGIQEDTMVDWEDDKSEPRANRLSMMAGMLNVSIMWLLTGEGDGMTEPGLEETVPGMGELVSELRDVRSNMRDNSERLARLEKRMRNMMKHDGA